MKIKQTQIFLDWHANLKDLRAKKHISARLVRFSYGNFGDVKSVGEGISETRIHYGPGYRVYFKQTGKEILVILCGGNKKSQQEDIQTAKKLIKEIEND